MQRYHRVIHTKEGDYMKYTVFNQGKELGTGTLTECIEFIAIQMSQFHPEQVTLQAAIDSGYVMIRA